MDTDGNRHLMDSHNVVGYEDDGPNLPIVNFVNSAGLDPIDLMNDENDDCVSRTDSWCEILSSLRDDDNDDTDDSSNNYSSSSQSNDNEIKRNAMLTTHDNKTDTNDENTNNEKPEKELSSISDELTCPLCLDIIVQATTLVPCGHTICLSCIPSTLANLTLCCRDGKECPVCRDPVTQTFPCRSVNNIIESIMRTQGRSSTHVTMKGFSIDDIQAYHDRCEIIEQKKRSAQAQCKNPYKISGNKRMRHPDFSTLHESELLFGGRPHRNVDFIRQPPALPQAHLNYNFRFHAPIGSNVDVSDHNTNVGVQASSISWATVHGFNSSQQLNNASTSAGSSADDAICLD